MISTTVLNLDFSKSYKIISSNLAPKLFTTLLTRFSKVYKQKQYSFS